MQSSLAKCLRRDRHRRSGDLASSGGGLEGSLGAGRLVIHRCSSRNNNNSSSGSGHSSYVDPGSDLSKRPLVVSFRRRSARASTDRRLHHSQAAYLPSRHTPRASAPPPALTSTPVPQQPRVEDIEIFQECQLKIQRSVKRHKDSRSCSALRQDKCNTSPNDSLKYVHKSFTVPCLVLH